MQASELLFQSFELSFIVFEDTLGVGHFALESANDVFGLRKGFSFLIDEYVFGRDGFI